MIKKDKKEVKEIVFDFSKSLEPGDEISHIVSLSTSVDSYFEGDIVIGKTSISSYLKGGVDNSSGSLKCCVKTKAGDVVCSSDILLIESFDFNQRIL